MSIKSTHDLIDRLCGLSCTIRAMNFASDIGNEPLEPHMYNFANRTAALEEVVMTVHTLTADLGLSAEKVRAVVKPLLSGRNFYGAYHELGVYRWLNNCGVNYEPQPEVAPGETLNQGGAIELDGRFSDAGVYFDIKSLGFQYHLKEEYRAKLEQELSARVAIDGSMSNSLRDIRTIALEDRLGFATVLNDLRSACRSQIRELNWDIRIPSKHERVTRETTTTNPYQLAAENCYYPFNFAKQFTRNFPLSAYLRVRRPVQWAPPYQLCQAR